jgi:hypothetical protein
MSQQYNLGQQSAGPEARAEQQRAIRTASRTGPEEKPLARRPICGYGMEGERTITKRTDGYPNEARRADHEIS